MMAMTEKKNVLELFVWYHILIHGNIWQSVGDVSLYLFVDGQLLVLKYKLASSNTVSNELSS